MKSHNLLWLYKGKKKVCYSYRQKIAYIILKVLKQNKDIKRVSISNTSKKINCPFFCDTWLIKGDIFSEHYKYLQDKTAEQPWWSWTRTACVDKDMCHLLPLQGQARGSVVSWQVSRLTPASAAEREQAAPPGGSTSFHRAGVTLDKAEGSRASRSPTNLTPPHSTSPPHHPCMQLYRACTGIWLLPQPNPVFPFLSQWLSRDIIPCIPIPSPWLLLGNPTYNRPLPLVFVKT